MNAVDEYRRRVAAACSAFAATQPNDPFAFDRAMSHHKNGVSGFRQEDSHMVKGLKAGDHAHYRATPYTVNAITTMGRALIEAGLIEPAKAITKVVRYKRITVPCS